MSATIRPAPRPAPARPHPRRRRLPPLPGRHQRGDLRAIDSSRRVDPRALRHRDAGTGPPPTRRVVDMARRGRRQGARRTPGSPPTQIGASSSPPSRTCCRPRRRPPPSPTGSAPPTPPPSTSRPRCAGFCYGARARQRHGRAAAAPSTSWSSACEKLSDLTDPTTAHRVPLRRRRGRGRGRPVRRARHRPDRVGLRRRPVRRDHPDAPCGSRPRRHRHEFPTLTHEGPGGVPLGRVRDGAGRASRRCDAAGHRPRTTWTRSSRTRPTCASSTRWSRR